MQTILLCFVNNSGIVSNYQYFDTFIHCTPPPDTLSPVLYICGMEAGCTRFVFLIGNYAIKIPRLNDWRLFLRGVLANIDEKIWYSNSPDSWKLKMCPTIFTFKGLLLIAKRAKPVTEDEFLSLELETFKPLPMDAKQSNFGWYDNRIVLVDYADSRYFCSDCERICFMKDSCAK